LQGRESFEIFFFAEQGLRLLNALESRFAQNFRATGFWLFGFLALGFLRLRLAKISADKRSAQRRGKQRQDGDKERYLFHLRPLYFAI
jgi:hypothetical protein